MTFQQISTDSSSQWGKGIGRWQEKLKGKTIEVFCFLAQYSILRQKSQTQISSTSLIPWEHPIDLLPLFHSLIIISYLSQGWLKYHLNALWPNSPTYLPRMPPELSSENKYKSNVSFHLNLKVHLITLTVKGKCTNMALRVTPCDFSFTQTTFQSHLP